MKAWRRSGGLGAAASTPAPNTVLQVTTEAANQATWLHSAAIDATGDVTGYRINGVSPTGNLGFAGAALTLSYLATPGDGDPWAVTASEVETEFLNGLPLADGSGNVI